MRVLVTGAAGQLGTEVARCFVAGDHEVVAAARAELDIVSRDQVLGVVGALRPAVIVNCAAFTAVDNAETSPEWAYATNALAVRHLAEASRRFGAHLCHISSDYVFSGETAEPYHEWDRPAPLSVYGLSKLAGEQEAGSAATVVRTSWLCGLGGNNVVQTVLGLASRGEAMRFVDDQRGSPSFATDVAEVVYRLCGERRAGLYHAANQGSATWYELARAVLAAAGYNPNLVTPITTAELSPPRLAKRPAYSVLENRACKLAGIGEPPPYGESLVRLVHALVR